MDDVDLLVELDIHDRLPPAVIDISASWRPARYADEVIVADNVGWFGVGRDMFERVTTTPDDTCCGIRRARRCA